MFEQMKPYKCPMLRTGGNMKNISLAKLRAFGQTNFRNNSTNGRNYDPYFIVGNMNPLVWENCVSELQTFEKEVFQEKVW